MCEIYYKVNSLWNKSENPQVTIVTSVYNRDEILVRAMKSVDNQTYKNIEYIVVNNGSTMNIDKVVEDFMANASIPMMYIKRSSGIGPHTGRNSGIKRARGKYICFIDSDDEYFPDAMKIFIDAWNSIPEKHRGEYREVVAQCVNEYGDRIGPKFPEGINDLSGKEAQTLLATIPGIGVEHANMSVTKQIQDYIFPEPTGVSYVIETVTLWDRLSMKYKSYFLNDYVRRYYVDSPDSITNQEIKKVTVKHCVNLLFADKFALDHWSEYDYSLKKYFRTVIHYAIIKNVLKIKNAYPNYDWVGKPVNSIMNKTMLFLCWIPSVFGAFYFIKTKM